MIYNVKDHGAIGDGVANDTAALQTALNAAYVAGYTLYIPSGTYLISSTLTVPTNTSSVFNKGIKIFGDGVENTIIKMTVADIVAFDFIQPTALKFQIGSSLSDMSIDGSSLLNTGIQMRGQYNISYKNLLIKNCKYGAAIVNTRTPGDYDACNHVSFENVRITTCTHWGVITLLVTGNNETSFISFKNSTIESCGTEAGAIGGGMYWRGQVLQFDSCAFVTNNNRGLYIEGGAGLGSNIVANNLVCENNKGMHIQCYGITGMTFNQLQMYSNDAFKASYGLYLSGASSLVSQVRVNSAKVRATPGNNPYIAFVSSGANALVSSIVVDDKQVRWDQFGSAGQTKYSGFTVV